MLDVLLKTLSPAKIASMIRENPFATLSVLQNFDSFVSFGNALTTDQQVLLSNNLPRIAEFLKSSEGKASVSVIAESFVDFVKASSTK